MTADNYDALLVPSQGILWTLMELSRMVPGLDQELPDIGGQIIACVGPQTENWNKEIPDWAVDATRAATECFMAGNIKIPVRRVATGDPESPTEQDSGQEEAIQGIRDLCRQCSNTPTEEVANGTTLNGLEASTEEQVKEPEHGD